MNIIEQDYNNFFFDLSAGLLRELGSGYETRPITNTRNNGILKNGILIRRENEAAAPAIYLDEYYQDFCTGKCLGDIIRQVLYTYHDSSDESKRQLFQDIDFSPLAMKDKVILRIVNYERNSALLHNIPYIRILDLAVVFHFMVYQDEDGIGTVRFTREHFCSFSDSSDGKTPVFTTVGELYCLALENTQRLFPVKLSLLDDVLKALLAQRGAPSIPFLSSHYSSGNREGKLFVLSNLCGINGSACILYPGILANLTKYFQSDFYILPSSIHELLLLPVTNSFQEDELNDMIREINLTQVPEEEVLSDRAYHSKDFLAMP
ncbi:MAG: hypothetical protein K2P87_07015 [Lachnospiraceae bacterium]|nr:hypothetical protein [Lachnospiraceae bacterium]